MTSGQQTNKVEIRRLAETDDLEQLTALLHRAYARLANMGLHFVATKQDVATTKERIQDAECYVATLDGRIVGTIVFRPCARTGGCAWYDRPDVASFGQFGVEPALQGMGIGARLLHFVEAHARATGAKEIALDTAEPATHLIDYYMRHGYRVVDRHKWHVVNYASVIMSKAL